MLRIYVVELKRSSRHGQGVGNYSGINQPTDGLRETDGLRSTFVIIKINYISYYLTYYESRRVIFASGNT